MKKYFLLIVLLCIAKVCLASNGKNINNIQSKSAKAKDTLVYTFELKNESLAEKTYHLQINHPRTLACQYILSENDINIQPNATYTGKLKVIVSDRIPKGGSESCSLIIEDETNESKHLKFVTVRSKDHPFLLVTNDVIEETKNKINNHAWAQINLEQMLKELEKYKIPKRKIVTKPRPVKIWSSFNYRPNDSETVFKLCLAWRLTGNDSFKQKAIQFIKEVCDKEEGYLSIGAATYGVQVHEGNFFLHLAAACDILYNEPEFSEEDKANIEATFRYYLDQNRKHMDPLGIMNHQASANAGAILSALFLQDVAEVNYLTEADGGMADQIGKGVMDDGWWFEGTVNYCYLVVERYSLVAQAFQNYGWDLYHRKFPVKFKSKDFDNAKEGFAGMKFDNWGPITKNTVGLEDMVTPYIPFMDEDANVVASNDSNIKTPDPFYELAYRAYQSDDLAWVLNQSKRGSWLSLLYGVAELPKTRDPRTNSSFAPNIGLVALRSQGEKENPENQIQAYFKYGTHGGWHGHFDRTNMVGLDRNGHKYFSTEMVWYGYGKPGYKESVQTSATHNMIVVDELQQEAVPSKQNLFYKGDLMQATIVETNARWRKIPKWNAEKFPPWEDTPYNEDFEPILQKRLSIVTDEYVVIADYIASNKKHNYDWLIHPVGFQSIKKAKKKGSLLDSLSYKKDSPYKYFSNAQWYKSNKGVEINFDEGGNKLDVYTLWPKKADFLVSDYPVGGKRKKMKNNPDRKTYGVRINKKEAEFLHVIAPYKGEKMISNIESVNANELIITLANGKKHKIKIIDLKSETVKIHFEEIENNKVIKTEEATSNKI